MLLKNKEEINEIQNSYYKKRKRSDIGKIKTCLKHHVTRCQSLECFHGSEFKNHNNFNHTQSQLIL